MSASITYLWKLGHSAGSNGSYRGLLSTSSADLKYAPFREPWSFSGSLILTSGRSMKIPLVSIGPKNRSAPVSATHLDMTSLMMSVLSLHSLSVRPV